MEVQGNAGFFQLLGGFQVVLPPDAQVFDGLFQGLHLYLVIVIAHEHTAGQADDVSVDEFRLHVFGEHNLLQALDKAVGKIHLRHQFP